MTSQQEEEFKYMKYVAGRLMPYISYIFLLILVVFTKNSSLQYLILPFPLFLLPLIDSRWVPGKAIYQSKYYEIVILILVTVCLLAIAKLITIGAVTAIFLFSAAPEEWFFRAYLQSRLGNNLLANTLTSLQFCLLHAITGDSIHAMLVFVPSMALGYVFEKSGSYWLVTSLHLLFNVLYVIFVN